ncbi:MAG: ABC transporter ATP-binding protein, partial [Firmicutes bacterium]|nr:ABC transporter ATP-binding protein [Bacillota bacterium]
MGPRKPKDTKATISRLFKYVGIHKVKIIIALTFVVLRTLANLAASYMLRPIINNYIVPGGGAEMVKGLAMGLALLGTVYLVNIFATYMQSKIMAYVSQNTLEAIRVDLFTKVQKLPVRYYDTNSTGDMMSRFTNDVDNIGMMLDHTLVSVFSGTITLVGTMAMMIYTNIWLTLITIFFIPVFMKAGAAIGKHSRKYYGAQQAALGAVNGYIEESVTGQKVVKV